VQVTPGLTNWTPASKQCDLYPDYQAVPGEIGRTQLRPNMFPPPEVAQLGLEKAVRLLPHHQNTGGFFIALLEKVSLCPWERDREAGRARHLEKVQQEGEGEKEENGAVTVKPSNPGREPPAKRFRGFKEDPFLYFNDDDGTYKEIQEYFGISLPARLFLTRCKDETKKNNIYFTTAAVRELVENNTEKVKIINTGVKAFARADTKGSDCVFRLAQEGALSTLPFVTKRVVRPDRADTVRILQSSDYDRPPDISQFSAGFVAQLEALPTGCIAFIYRDTETGVEVEVVGWKGKQSLRAYVPKNDRMHYLRLLGEDTSIFEVNKFEEKKEKDRERREARERREEENDDQKCEEGGEIKSEEVEPVTDR